MRQDVIAATVDWTILLTAGLLVALAMLLAFLLRRRDPEVGRTRFGFFIERDRYGQEETWPEFPPTQRTLPNWPDKTAEIPPEEEPSPTSK